MAAVKIPSSWVKILVPIKILSIPEVGEKQWMKIERKEENKKTPKQKRESQC